MAHGAIAEETPLGERLTHRLTSLRGRSVGPRAPRAAQNYAPPMFERFTDRARRVLVLAQEEAMLQNHSYIGTEHILLGTRP